MTVTTNYLVTGNGITGSTANAVQALMSGAGIAAKLRGGSAAVLNGDTSWLLPTHLPILSPERHTAMSPIVVGSLTASYQTGGERGRGMIRLAASGAIASTAVRVPLPLSAEYGTYAKASARVHIRVKCSDWTKVTRLYVGLAQDGGSSNYHLLKIVESNISRVGCTDATHAAVWSGQWRTIVEHSDKKTVVGAADTWDRTTRYLDGIDGIVFTVTTSAAVDIEFDRIYSPDWPVGFSVNIFDGAYKSARDLVLPQFAQRGWLAGFSGNRVDGSTSGITTYPTLADLAACSAAGHDVFMHGHYLSGATPTPMTSSVTEAEALEILRAGRSAIAGVLAAGGARGLRWHQWLTNVGRYAGTDMAGLLASLGIQAARGACTDAQYGLDPWDALVTTWSSSPATESGTDICGYVSHLGRYNRLFAEYWDGTSGALGRDTYEGSGIQKGLQYAANCGDGFVAYTHNIVPYDGTNPTSNDTGTNWWAGYLADLDARVAAGQILVLSPTQLEMLTYWRDGDIYLRWDGEWVSRSTGAIAF